MYAYAGFPRSLNGITTFMAVLTDRRARGITDEPGREAGPLPADKSSVELGTENQTRLIGGPATGEYLTFAPAVDQFLKGHLFGDIFGRDVLDFRSREIATIAALAAIDGVELAARSPFRHRPQHRPDRDRAEGPDRCAAGRGRPEGSGQRRRRAHRGAAPQQGLTSPTWNSPSGRRGPCPVEGVKGLHRAGGSSRRDAVAKAAESVGGRLERFHFAFGEHDAVVLAEGPDNQHAAAVTAAGGASVRTVVAVGARGRRPAVKRSIDYRPPQEWQQPRHF